MESQNSQVEAPLAQRRVYKRRDRHGVQLPITRQVYQQFRRRARAEGLPFASWLTRLALKELRRKPTL
jgi:hypothetical protein